MLFSRLVIIDLFRTRTHRDDGTAMGDVLASLLGCDSMLSTMLRATHLFINNYSAIRVS